jgi:YHS domain-containing protein
VKEDIDWKSSTEKGYEMLKKCTLMLAGAVMAAGVGGRYAHAADPHAHGTPKNGAAVVCPVMKGPVKNTAKAPRLMVNNSPVYFCCAGCPAAFKKEPAKYLKRAVKDPVTGKPFRVTAKTPRMEYQGALFLFSSAASHDTFHKNPAKYIRHGKHHPGGSHGA